MNPRNSWLSTLCGKDPHACDCKRSSMKGNRQWSRCYKSIECYFAPEWGMIVSWFMECLSTLVLCLVFVHVLIFVCSCLLGRQPFLYNTAQNGLHIHWLERVQFKLQLSVIHFEYYVYQTLLYNILATNTLLFFFFFCFYLETSITIVVQPFHLVDFLLANQKYLSDCLSSG